MSRLAEIPRWNCDHEFLNVADRRYGIEVATREDFPKATVTVKQIMEDAGQRLICGLWWPSDYIAAAIVVQIAIALAVFAKWIWTGNRNVK